MKVAIIMAGPYRGNSSIIKAHKKFIGEYDTYVSCFKHYLNDWKNSGWDIKEYFITPKINYKKTNWIKHRDDKPGESGFWQFWNLRNVIHETLCYDYEWYIKSRCDLLFSNADLTSDFFKSLKKNTLYCPEEMGLNCQGKYWDLDKTINDQFFIGDKNCMDIIAKFVVNFYENKREKGNHYGNEYNLRIWLKENNINIEKIKEINYKKDFNGESKPSGEVKKFQLENL